MDKKRDVVAVLRGDTEIIVRGERSVLECVLKVDLACGVGWM